MISFGATSSTKRACLRDDDDLFLNAFDLAVKCVKDSAGGFALVDGYGNQVVVASPIWLSSSINNLNISINIKYKGLINKLDFDEELTKINWIKLIEFRSGHLVYNFKYRTFDVKKLNCILVFI